MPLILQPADVGDFARVSRIRPPAGMGRFVHYNWFWLKRALVDPEITFAFVRGGPRSGITGCIAYGPHELIDLDPSSRRPEVGEIYHVVIHRQSARRGQGAAAIVAAISAMRSAAPRIKAVRVSHHADNHGAARLYAKLGFVEIGVKTDGETGICDRLLELSLS